MRDLWRRIGLSILLGAVLLATYAFVYRWGMATFEGEQLSYPRAFQVALEVLTTAGFGGDAPWKSTGMNLLIVGMNLTGVVLLFFGIPYFLLPLLEDAIQTDVPTATDLSEHVVVCADSDRGDALRRELAGEDVPSLFVEADETIARRRLGQGVEVVHGDPEAADTLRNANLASARALVVDVDDETNANVILAARRLAPDLRIVSVVEDAAASSYHEHAGADEVVRPRVVVAGRLVEKVLGPDLRDALLDEVGPVLAEYVVERDDPLAGTTLADTALSASPGVTVVGGWFHGEFVAPVDPSRRLSEHSLLLLAGETGRLETIPSRSVSTGGDGRVVVAGNGVVGRAIADGLVSVGVDVSLVDRVDEEGVDVVGDVTEPETLTRAGLRDADAAVVALDRDPNGVYATLVARERTPSVPLLARADDVESVQRFYDAGTDYVLSLSRVTAHMVAGALFPDDGDDSIGECGVERLPAGTLAESRLDEADIRAETGATVVAIERDRNTIVSPAPDCRLAPEDTLVAIGTPAALDALTSMATGEG